MFFIAYLHTLPCGAQLSKVAFGQFSLDFLIFLYNCVPNLPNVFHWLIYTPCPVGPSYQKQLLGSFLRISLIFLYNCVTKFFHWPNVLGQFSSDCLFTHTLPCGAQLSKVDIGQFFFPISITFLYNCVPNLPNGFHWLFIGYTPCHVGPSYQKQILGSFLRISLIFI